MAGRKHWSQSTQRIWASSAPRSHRARRAVSVVDAGVSLYAFPPALQGVRANAPASNASTAPRGRAQWHSESARRNNTATTDRASSASMIDRPLSRLQKLPPQIRKTWPLGGFAKFDIVMLGILLQNFHLSEDVDCHVPSD